jgi:hypothetical protein
MKIKENNTEPYFSKEANYQAITEIQFMPVLGISGVFLNFHFDLDQP